MAAPPTGTVSFLFTDVEGSTIQATADAAAWSAARARHNEIVRAATDASDGFTFQVVGDAYFAAFSTVGRAVAAALAAQRQLHAEQWPVTTVKVRMGLHAGPAEWKHGDYEGYLTLAHTQRVMEVGHGGQVLLSQAAADLAVNELPADVALRDLGEHRLKDLPHAERLFQLVAADLPADFPPLRLQGAEANNLPAQLTSFIGRETELADLRPLLDSNRLLTLTGPGGTGKTRLALRLAEVLDTYAAGAWLIELASVFDPDIVPQAVASTLGVHEQPGRTVLDVLTDYVRTKSMLLILDNCEHLIGSCARLADVLLRAAPGLRILATSRESLRISGEMAFRVPPLTVPDPGEQGDLARLARNACVQLFVDRASAADPRFQLTETNAPAVSEICLRLDGIPLAIELAAARTKVLPPEQIAALLDDRFRLLTGGARTALERHQTLSALIDWSHDLLSDPERVLLRRLSVFAGGWALDTAQAVCNGALAEGTLDTIARLADKSMIVIERPFESEGRFRLLETIRQYALEKLRASGESEQVRDRHLAYFLRFAEAIEPELRGVDQLAWLSRMKTEHKNLRTALAWSLESGKSESALRLAGALSYFWELRGYWTEARKWLEAALSSSEREQSKTVVTGVPREPSFAAATETYKAARAKVLYASGRFHFGLQLEPSVSRAIVEEALKEWRELGDKWWMAVSLEHVGWMLRWEGDVAGALAPLEEGVSLAREVQDRWPLVLCLMRLAVQLFGTDVAASLRLYEEAEAIARTVGDKNILGQVLVLHAMAYFLTGDLSAAAPLATEALAEGRAIGSVTTVWQALLAMAVVTCLQGDPTGAKGHCLKLLDFGRETGSSYVQSHTLFGFGFVACFSEHPERGVLMLAAFRANAGDRGMSPGLVGPVLMMHQQALERARAKLEPAVVAAATEEGQVLTLEEALELATED